MKIGSWKRFLITIIVIIVVLFLLRKLVAIQLYNRGFSYMNYSLYDDAIREYEKALLFNPRFDKAYNWLGYSYWQKGDNEKALAIYTKAGLVNPQNRTAFFDKGMVYVRKREYVEALPCFEQAAAIEPQSENDRNEFIQSLHWVSICQRELGQIEQAKATCQNILKINPGNVLAEQRLAKMINLD